jgi:signal transduction histidine kinase
MVRIHVTDQGPGIAPADVEHVFERFYRADTSRAKDPASGRPTGLGLGLTIARELLTANGGRIAVERTGPNGTTFVLEVPAAAVGCSPATRAGSRSVTRPASAPGPGRSAP